MRNQPGTTLRGDRTAPPSTLLEAQATEVSRRVQHGPSFDCYRWGVETPAASVLVIDDERHMREMLEIGLALLDEAAALSR